MEIPKSIHQSVTFSASPHEVYELLMDSKKHAAFSGEAASISRKVGGKIKAYGDYIEGKNLELEADKKIVQLWRASDWPKGQYSTVTFTFHTNKNRHSRSLLRRPACLPKKSLKLKPAGLIFIGSR